jgi:hypothetical protein
MKSDPPKVGRPIGRPLGLRHAEQTRRAIQATKLVQRLQACAMGTLDLTKEQIRSIEILLKKTLPDLSSVELTGDADRPVTYQRIERVILDGPAVIDAKPAG